jgi:hypothetical protein
MGRAKSIPDDTYPAEFQKMENEMKEQIAAAILQGGAEE